MPPAEPPSEITIRVKVPPGHIPGAVHDEFSLGILSTSLSIEALRQRIQTLIPTNPAPAQQRILYGGRALADDNQSIADALNTRRDTSQNEYVIHLLIRDGARAIQPRADGSNVAQRTQSQQQSGHAHGQDAQQAGRAFPPHVNPLLNPATLQQLQAQADQVIQSVHEHDHDRLMANLRNMQPGGAAPEQNTPNQQPHTSQSTPTQTPGAQHVPRPHHHHHHHHRQPHFHPDPAWPAQQAIPRPISGQGVHVSGTGPNGQHFSYHHQTFAVPNGHFPHPGGMPVPPGIPGLPHNLPGLQQQNGLPHNLPGMPQQNLHQHNLQRSASQNDALRPQNTTNSSQPGDAAAGTPTAQQGAPQLTQLQAQAAAMEELLAAQRARGPLHPPAPHQFFPAPFRNHFGLPAHPSDALRPFPNMPMVTPHAATDHVSVYLLSSPQGPQALVFDSQHGSFTGALHPVQSSFPAPTPTQAIGAIPAQPQNDAAAQQNAQPGQVVPAEPIDNFAILQPLLGHLWLLIRVMIFAYVLIGSNMGWRRPAALALIAIGFWLLRLGLFGNGGVVRRWWDGIVRVEDIRERLQRLGLPVEGQRPADGPNPPQQADPARPFPTPEELAQRLVQEQRDRSALHRFREQIRPVERAFALFVASLWPGVGERYVRALDEAREAEEAARRELQRQQEAAQQEAAQREADAKTEQEKQTEPVEGVPADAVASAEGSASAAAAPASSPSAAPAAAPTAAASAQEQIHES